MTKFTGIRLNFDKKGEATIVPAQKVLPSRQDRIQTLIEKIEDVTYEYPDKAIEEIQMLLFNPKAKNFRPGIKPTEYSRELSLQKKFLELIEPVEPQTIIIDIFSKEEQPDAVA